MVFVYRSWRGAAETAATRTPRTIAVLPFKTIGGAGGDEEYLGLGMCDALITRLGRSRQLVVRPTSAVRRYNDPNQDPLAAGRQQGVEVVLDGSIQRVGDNLRVTVQLFRVVGGESLWSEQFDEPFTNIFAVQDTISQRVLRGLLVELKPEEQKRLNRRGTESIEAYQAYLRGRYFWNQRTDAGYRKALEHFNRALELDPAYAQAYVGLADVTWFLGGDNWPEQMKVAKSH
jgi:TolB-like protein